MIEYMYVRTQVRDGEEAARIGSAGAGEVEADG